ncbi:ABC transporter ATP-binding protein [Paenibacillus alvei]|uniref:ABC transporter ATP-binding protein n=1 Tax=Paenibacillus alvei TaxID=44250 RepID=UPI0018CCBDA3|nr:ABC transporter ATP-binding protein [Paenibacillus alvei]MBG9737138.1 spermidine/putrescine ABC transporter ATP-binding protein [Paenibacillus alvei]MBG9746231.1 spermidine/putrescine ABC transporter ATP-binding protein [Paenibacillus alvei]MCY9579653.1 ABC transporter ATP-binding protein [Paenibacillus alvei]MCY9586307.1 ABC transporter ATP-binding protein [Paenibacillus alvei]
MIEVALEHVSKQFGNVKGVTDVNIRIQPGEFFTFLGPSGCGKTTTLRMIAGFYFPSEGRIAFGNQDVTTIPPNKRNTGMVFQNYALFPHMTVFENIAFGLQVRKVPKSEVVERVERAQRQVHLEGYGNRRIDQLSGGQQQRVALARALVIEPQILLLDEPLSNLDAKLREETRIEIKRLQLELGITTIYVTHDQAEAMAMSDRIMVMQGGVVQQIGSPEEIYNRPVNRFVASFIGESNLWEGTVEQIENDEAVVRVAPGLSLRGLAANVSPDCTLEAGRKVTLSIRPESIREARQDDIGDNIVMGNVVISEFTGVSVNYVSQVADQQLKAMFVNQGHRVRGRGEAISMLIPKESIYFLG